MKYIAVYAVGGFANFSDAFDWQENSCEAFDEKADALAWIESSAADRGRDVSDYSIYVRHAVKQTVIMEA